MTILEATRKELIEWLKQQNLIRECKKCSNSFHLRYTSHPKCIDSLRVPHLDMIEMVLKIHETELCPQCEKAADDKISGFNR